MPSMRIGLNATCFNERPSGARQRFEGIYGALIRRRPDLEFVVYEPRDCRVGRWFADAPNVQSIATPLPSVGRLRRTAGGLSFWRRQLRRDRLDLFEMFHLPMFRAPHCPTVQTIHDVRDVSATMPFVQRSIAHAVVGHALRKANTVVTVSDTMKEELQSIEPGAKVVTIYNGIDPLQLSAGVADLPTLPAKYLLAVGHIEERKNYRRLLEALVIIRRDFPSMALIIVGNDGGQASALRAAIAEHSLHEQVHVMHNVGTEQLAALYHKANAVVFPSLYEGFGIPILEAMAAHRPLAVSDLPVFVELTEGQGQYFSPREPGDIARKIAQLLTDPARQAEIVRYGDQRVRDFSFDALAVQVEHLYAKLRPDLLAPRH